MKANEATKTGETVKVSLVIREVVNDSTGLRTINTPKMWGADQPNYEAAVSVMKVELPYFATTTDNTVFGEIETRRYEDNGTVTVTRRRYDWMNRELIVGDLEIEVTK